MPIIPRLVFRACTTLMCLGLILTCDLTGATTTDECSQTYKVCNIGCNRQIIESGSGFCKIQCDYRLIACDQQSAAAALAAGSRYPVSKPAR